MAERRCTAHNRQGGQCERAALTGTNVCRYHGGAAPQVQRSIRQRLLEAADPALSKMLWLMEQGERDHGVQQRAAADILDRAGYKPSDKVELTGADGGPLRIAVLYKNADGTQADADDDTA